MSRGDDAQGSADEPLPDEVEELDVREADAARPARHTVYTARYRLIRKGAERGRWEFGFVAEADAPLLSVHSVVRGVQRRAGEDVEPELLTADGVRSALRLAPCTTTA